MIAGCSVRIASRLVRFIAMYGQAPRSNCWGGRRFVSGQFTVGGVIAPDETIRTKQTRYALIMTLKAQNVDVDLYAPIKAIVDIPSAEVKTEI